MNRGKHIPATTENIHNLIVSFAAYSIYCSQPRTLGPYTEAFNLVISLRIPYRIQIPIYEPHPQSSLPIYRSDIEPDNISINVVLFWPHRFYYYGTKFRPEPHLVKPSSQRNQLQTLTKWEARILANQTHQSALPPVQECRKDITLRPQDTMDYIKKQAAGAIDDDPAHARLRLFVAGVDITTCQSAEEANLHEGSIIRAFY